jgi:hypothetical protein
VTSTNNELLLFVTLGSRRGDGMTGTQTLAQSWRKTMNAVRAAAVVALGALT